MRSRRPIPSRLLPTASFRVTLGVQAVVVDGEGRILLVRHGYRPGWHFPGGGVERGETLEAALARELEEETGVALSEPAHLVGIYTHFDVFPGDHVVLFQSSHWRRPCVPLPNREIAEQGFFAPGFLPQGTSAGTRRRIAEIFFGALQSSSW